jgi:hypothetical protein
MPVGHVNGSRILDQFSRAVDIGHQLAIDCPRYYGLIAPCSGLHLAESALARSYKRSSRGESESGIFWGGELCA